MYLIPLLLVTSQWVLWSLPMYWLCEPREPPRFVACGLHVDPNGVAAPTTQIFATHFACEQKVPYTQSIPRRLGRQAAAQGGLGAPVRLPEVTFACAPEGQITSPFPFDPRAPSLVPFDPPAPSP
jgi:hypothetical protein